MIEDDYRLATMVRSYLSASGFEVVVADDAARGLRLLDKQAFDLVLLDLMLPDGNGFTILKKLKNNNKTDGVIIISAKETLETRIEGFNLGADDYLIKPFHLSELLVRIQALIRRKNFKGNNLVIHTIHVHYTQIARATDGINISSDYVKRLL